MAAYLADKVDTLSGIGPKYAARLEAQGLSTLGDLIWWLPKRFEDLRKPTPIAELVVGQRALTGGTVTKVERWGRGTKSRLTVAVDDGSGTLRLVWFSAPSGIERRYETGRKVTVSGRVSEFGGSMTIAHPEFHKDESTQRLLARYQAIDGVGASVLRNAIAQAVQAVCEQVPDVIEPMVRASRGWTPVGRALTALHQPDRELTDEQAQAYQQGRSQAHIRLAIEELFAWELGVRRRRVSHAAAQALVAAGSLDKSVALLPFAPTDAQRRVAKEIATDLARKTPMRRLLQGDVGSGKTAVAFMVAMVACEAGSQVAFVAPTAVLARQLHARLSKLAAPAKIEVSLLHSGLARKQKAAVTSRIADGTVQIVVGTHALCSDDVVFARLGLVVVDEQHRFGVAQRLAIANGQGDSSPHLLVMTATPIPRTLAHTMYADLDLSVIDAMPAGRQPIVTKSLGSTKRANVHRQMQRALDAGGRVFVVCPTIEPSPGLRSAQSVHAELRQRFKAVGLLHGAMSSDDQAKAMADFSAGALNVLVCTTVVEVGVDVPDANLVVIEQAERFGLAQLHQLRGRVGRAGQKSACLLVHDKLTEDAEARLSTLCETQDGFEIAQRDLELRGPGHFFGFRQSGPSALRFADLRTDGPLLKQVAEAVDESLAARATAGASGPVVATPLGRAAANVALREDAG